MAIAVSRHKTTLAANVAGTATVGLCADYTRTSAGELTPVGEPTGGAYAAQSFTFTAPERDGDSYDVFVENDAPIEFPTPTDTWGVLEYAVIRLDGVVTHIIALDTPVDVGDGDTAPVISAGVLRLTSADL